MQNHQGVYRTRGGGQSWEEITEGLPFRSAFRWRCTRDQGMLWVFPLNGDSEGRF